MRTICHYDFRKIRLALLKFHALTREEDGSRVKHGLGWCGPRPIHVVVADDPETQEPVVITAYEPDPFRWDSTFRVRRQEPQ